LGLVLLNLGGYGMGFFNEVFRPDVGVYHHFPVLNLGPRQLGRYFLRS
jgi:hypothetical protein